MRAREAMFVWTPDREPFDKAKFPLKGRMAAITIPEQQIGNIRCPTGHAISIGKKPMTLSGYSWRSVWLASSFTKTTFQKTKPQGIQPSRGIYKLSFPYQSAGRFRGM
jgi:hypothetical protein